MGKEDIIKDKSMDFAIRVVSLCKYLKKEKQECHPIILSFKII